MHDTFQAKVRPAATVHFFGNDDLPKTTGSFVGLAPTDQGERLLVGAICPDVDSEPGGRAVLAILDADEAEAFAALIIAEARALRASAKIPRTLTIVK